MAMHRLIRLGVRNLPYRTIIKSPQRAAFTASNTCLQKATSTPNLNMNPRVGVGVFVLNDHGEIIIGKRKGSHGAGTYAFPGGHLEFGEGFEECAIREIMEETGLAIGNVKFLTATNDVMVSENKHYITIFMGCTIIGENKKPEVLEPEKCEGWEWTTWEKLRNECEVQIKADMQAEPTIDSATRRYFQPIPDILLQQPGFDPLESMGISRQ